MLVLRHGKLYRPSNDERSFLIGVKVDCVNPKCGCGFEIGELDTHKPSIDRVQDNGIAVCRTTCPECLMVTPFDAHAKKKVKVA